MSRRRHGKLRPLTGAERAARRARNERRGRSPRERRWERDTIVRERPDPVHSVTTVQTRSKASRLKEAMRERFFKDTRDQIARHKAEQDKAEEEADAEGSE
jgi:hypothetical protein